MLAQVEQPSATRQPKFMVQHLFHGTSWVLTVATRCPHMAYIVLSDTIGHRIFDVKTGSYLKAFQVEGKGHDVQVQVTNVIQVIIRVIV